MKIEIVEKWTEALRSGKYKQTAGFLKDPVNNSFCCLGVLCDLYNKETGKGQWVSESYRFMAGGNLYGDSSTTSLPPSVMEWAGILNRDGAIESIFSSLMSMNDAGMSFKQIAEIIEKHKEEL